VGLICSTHDGDHSCVQNFNRKILKENATLNIKTKQMDNMKMDVNKAGCEGVECTYLPL
jgi:hypothetical protein